MDLVVFDLDGTLFNSEQKLSAYTKETLALLAKKKIAFTVATGRTLHAAVPSFEGLHFPLPQVYKNGVLIWDPVSAKYSHGNFLTHQEVEGVLEVFDTTGLSPFIMTVTPENHQHIYHGPIHNAHGEKLLKKMQERPNASVHAWTGEPVEGVTNITTIGAKEPTEAIIERLRREKQLCAFYGPDMYKADHYWMDIHHIDASKGGAIEMLKSEYGFKRVICFGDGDNDISMFQMSDECYAPENADPEIKAMATAVIGHHDQDGIAHFLRERFQLDDQ
jgi:Cof subfamily protein (haloacid dehalogenase superfamily)